jgi:signal transduction histidine kinase
MIARVRRLPILWQTLLLLLATLIVAQAVNTILLVRLPLPRTEFVSLGDLAEALGAPRRDDRGRDDRGRGGRRGRDDRAVRLPLAIGPTPPDLANLATSDSLTARLAARLGVATDAVRLGYAPDQSTFPFRPREQEGGVALRHGEPIFVDATVAAFRRPDGRWLSVHTPARPILTEWHKRMILWLALSLLPILPLAFLFARQLARPIHRFAEAADRIGRDPESPPMPMNGPAELDRAAVALTGMQDRLHDMLTERTAMAGAIAHDLRTPLARIAFRIEQAPEPVREAVLHDIEQMRAMIAATIGFVKGVGDLGPHGTVDLHALLARLAGAARDMGSAVTLTGQPVTLSGSPVALERLFQNLVDNAVAYAGGAEIDVGQGGGRVRVTIADRGPGLPANRLDSVFKPFNRGDPSRNRTTGGVGLGLAIARSIATAHGGTVAAANRDGGGLVVTVDLPA